MLVSLSRTASSYCCRRSTMALRSERELSAIRDVYHGRLRVPEHIIVDNCFCEIS